MATPAPKQPLGDNSTRTSSSGMQLGPPGRWWDDKQYAKTLGIDSNQQHRMDQVFNVNRDALFAKYNELKHEEAELTRLTQAASPDEKQVDAQIEKIAQARAELAKANAHMVLALRKELTPEQATKLDQH